MPRLLLLTLFGLFVTGAAEAASCNLSVENLDFGQVDTLYGEAVDTAGTLGVDCDQVSAGVSTVTMCIHIGAGSGGTAGGRRRLVSDGSALAFEIHQDAARSVKWGSSDAPDLGSARELRMAVSDGRASATIPFYGRVVGSQSGAASGSYAASFAGGDTFVSHFEGDGADCGTQGAMAKSPFAFAVRAVVPDNCLVETSDIAFGQHGVIDRNIDASGTIGIVCTPGTGFTVRLNGGLAAASDPERRIMQAGDHRIVYGLYRDEARTQPWGNSDGDLSPGTGAGQKQSLVVYGRVPPQPAAAGLYHDIVGVTISYGGP